MITKLIFESSNRMFFPPDTEKILALVNFTTGKLGNPYLTLDRKKKEVMTFEW